MQLELMLFMVGVLIMSIIIHEVAHGYAALRLGDVTAKVAGRLTLNPTKHADPIGSVLIPGVLVLTGASFLFGWAKPVPYNPHNVRGRYGEAFVAIAGVATNFFLALVFALIARYTAGAGMDDFARLSAIVVLVNLSLGLFNLLPLPPFDGFSFLRSVAPFSLAVKMERFEESLMRGGLFTLVGILLLFSFFLAEPFGSLLQYIFGLLVVG